MMREGQLVAANTDVGAIAILLARLHEAKARMGSVTLLGNGGAARAALVALKLIGIAANVRIQARDLAEAIKLAIEFGLEAEPAPFTAPIVSDGLINATPLGMTGRDCLDCDLQRMPRRRLGVRHGLRPGRNAVDRSGSRAAVGRRAPHAGRAGRGQLQAVLRPGPAA